MSAHDSSNISDELTDYASVCCRISNRQKYATWPPHPSGRATVNVKRLDFSRRPIPSLNVEIFEWEQSPQCCRNIFHFDAQYIYAYYNKREDRTVTLFFTKY